MSALPIHVGLTTTSASIGTSELLTVSAAVQKQVIRDFGPLWNISATVDAFASLDDIPVGYLPVIVVDQVAAGEGGVHGQRDKQPLALVKAGPNWSLTASHEVLEMLADPFSNRLIAGDSIGQEGKRVEYLVEVCDPCQDPTFAYQVNGIVVSDFYTPSYFDAAGSTAARYDFIGAISHPRQVLDGGYLSWKDPTTNHLHRADMIGTELWLSDLGEVPATVVSLRALIDSNPRARSRKRIKLSRKHSLIPKPSSQRGHLAASRSKSKALRQQFKSLRSTSVPNRNQIITVDHNQTSI